MKLIQDYSDGLDRHRQYQRNSQLEPYCAFLTYQGLRSQKASSAWAKALGKWYFLLSLDKAPVRAAGD